MRRRSFLSGLARAGLAGAALSSVPPWAREALAAAAPSDFIVRNDWPEHLETRVAALGRSWITPNDAFFVRSHFPVPDIDAATWRLEIAGRVKKPRTFTLAELQALPTVYETHLLECAGNGRGLMHLPSTSGTQWGRGAVGNAVWGGVPLGALLERVGIEDDARHVWFEAADEAPLPGAPRFVRSISIGIAVTDAILAHTMNGRPLPRLHGAPLRAIVPGWFGMASTKWLTRIRVETTPSDNHFMAKGYHYVYDPPGTDPPPAVDHARVKSLITHPLEGAKVPVGPLRVRGFAWAGPGKVKAVDVALGAPEGWTPAVLNGEPVGSAWRAWSADVTVRHPGRLVILSRATDVYDQVQPLEARANAGGYGNNAMDAVTVDARA